MRKNHRAGAAVKRNSVHNRCGCQKYVIQEQGARVKWRGEACFGSRLLSEGKKFQHVDCDSQCMQLHIQWILFSPFNDGIALLFECFFLMCSHLKVNSAGSSYTAGGMCMSRARIVHIQLKIVELVAVVS